MPRRIHQAAASSAGGVLFGLIGNRIGRQAVLPLSSMTTGLGILLIGCLPTAEMIGFTLMTWRIKNKTGRKLELDTSTA